MRATSLSEGLQADACLVSSAPLQDLWLPHATWVLPSHVIASHHAQGCIKASASLLQRKTTLHNETYATSSTSVRQWINHSIKVEHVANHAYPASLAATQHQVGKNGAANQLLKKTNVAPSRFVLPTGFLTVIKSLCIFSNVLFQLSPIPQVRQFHKRKDTGDTDAAPFVSIMYGGMQWSFYGLFAFIVTKNADVLVLVYSSMGGAILGFYYVHGFYKNCSDEKLRQRLSMYCKLAGTLATFQLLATVLLEVHQALLFIGFISSVCSMTSAVSLLTTLPQVFQSRCSSSINVPLLSTGMFGACIWLICGFMMDDVWILIPNAVSLVLQSCAATVAIVFPREQDEQLFVSTGKHVESKMATKDVAVAKAAPLDASLKQQPLSQQQGATCGQMPDGYGSMKHRQGDTGSTS